MQQKLTKDELSHLLADISLDDENAFKEFFHNLQPSIFYFLYRYIFDYEIAKDLCQETFIKFWQNRHKIDITKSPRAYLYKIARNLALNYIDRLPKLTNIADKDSILVQYCNNPEGKYELDFAINDFKKAIIYLPERCRVIFMLSRFHGFTYEEIAATLEISLQTVKNQMNKSIAILRKSLQSHID